MPGSERIRWALDSTGSKVLNAATTELANILSCRVGIDTWFHDVCHRQLIQFYIEHA